MKICTTWAVFVAGHGFGLQDESADLVRLIFNIHEYITVYGWSVLQKKVAPENVSLRAPTQSPLYPIEYPMSARLKLVPRIGNANVV